MKKNVFVWLMLIALPFIGFCQYSVSGVIKDLETSETLAGANVVIENTFIGASTNEQGLFNIKNLKKGKYTIKISFIGYISYSQLIDINTDLVLNIQLEKSHILEETVIIRATNASEKTPTTFKNISVNEIKQVNLGQDLPYLISNTPSVVTTSDAGAGVGYTNIRIRGSDITRINVTMNGIPMNDPESQVVFFVDLPDFASSVDNIQIIRGVGSSANGAAAFGSSINIQTLKLNPIAYGEINNSFGSFNTMKNNVMFGTGLIDKKWSFDGRLSNLSSDGYIDRASSKLNSYFVSAAYYGNKSIIKLNVFSGKEKTYQAWNGVPQDSLKTNRTFNPFNYKNQTDNYKQNHYQLIFSNQVNDTWNINMAIHYTHGEGYYEEYKSGADFANYGMDTINIKDSIITQTDLIRQQWLRNDFYGITYSANYDSKNKLKLSFGGALNQYDGDHFGKVIWATYASNGDINKNYYENNGLKTDFNIYAKLIYSLTKRFDIFMDMQYRYIGYSFVGYDRNLNNVKQKVELNFINPKAGLNFNINKNNVVYASMCIGNKEPDRNDYVESTSDSRPKNETLYDAEAGYKFNNTRIDLSANLFYMDYKNQLVLTGKINDVGEYTRSNIDKSYRTGLEVDAAFLIFQKLKLTANAAYSINKINHFTEYLDDYSNGGQIINKYNNTDIAFSPSIVSSCNLSYTIFKNLSAVFTEKYVGKQYLDNTSNSHRMINEYMVSDIRIHYIIKTKLMKEIGINAMVNNVFNKMYESNGWSYSYVYDYETITENAYYPQAGINFLVGLSLKF